MFLGPGSQPSSVVVSGTNVSSTVTFSSGGSLSVPLPPFGIMNDVVALETLERYSLSLSNPSVTGNVVAADSTDITIMDNDSKPITNIVIALISFTLLFLVVSVQFENSQYSYSEDEGTVDDIMIILNRDIATELVVGYNGGNNNSLSY